MKKTKKELLNIIIAYIIAVLILAGISMGLFFVYISYQNPEIQLDEVGGSNWTYELPVEKRLEMDFIAKGNELDAIAFRLSDFSDHVTLNVTYGLSIEGEEEFVCLNKNTLTFIPNEKATLSLPFFGDTDVGMEVIKGQKYHLTVVLTPVDLIERIGFFGLNHERTEQLNAFGYTVNGEEGIGALCRSIYYKDSAEGQRWFIVFLLLLDLVLLAVFHKIYTVRKSICIYDKERNNKGISLMPSGFYIRLLAYACLVIAIMLGRGYQKDYSILFLLIALIVNIGGYITDIIRKAEYNKKYVIQAFAVSITITIWLASALISKNTDKSHVIIIALEIINVVVMNGFFGARLYKTKEEVYVKIRNILKSNCWIIFPIVFTLILSMDAFRWVPIWDDLAYIEDYVWNRAWNFTFSEPLFMNPCTHYALGTKLFLLPGIVVDNPVIGTRIVLLLGIIVMAISLHALMIKLLPDIARWEVGLVTILLLAFPPVLGMQNINLDYVSCLFIIPVLACYYYDYNLMGFIFACLLCGSKEPMVILYAGMCIGIFIREIVINNINEKHAIINCMSFSKYLRLGMPAVLWVLTFLGNKLANIELPALKLVVKASDGYKDIATSSWGQMSFDANGNVIINNNRNLNVFGFDYNYINTILEQILTFHFMWLLVILAIISVIVGYVLKKKINNADIYPIVGSFITITIFNCGFITNNDYRYRICVQFLLEIIFVFYICNLIKWKKICISIISIMLILFIIEQFNIIDPITMSEGKSFDTGRGTLISVDKDNPVYIAPPIEVNRQGGDYGYFLQKIYREIECDGRTLVLCPEMKEMDNIKALSGSLFHNRFWFDKEKGRLDTFGNDGIDGEQVNWGRLNTDGTIDYWSYIPDGMESPEYDRVFIIDYPFGDMLSVGNLILRAGFTEISRKNVSYRSWKADVIELNAQ